MEKIVFDIDGVLTDLNLFLLEYGRNYFELNNGKLKEKYDKKFTVVDENASNLKDMFDCDSEIEKDFWTKNYFFIQKW